MNKIHTFFIVCLASLIPVGNVTAETFVYTLDVEQPNLAVSVTSTTPEPDKTLVVDRTQIYPLVPIDKIVLDNTGDVDAEILAKVVTTRTDGGPNLIYATGNPGTATQISPGFYTPGTTSILGPNINATDAVITNVTMGQKREVDYNIKVHKDFSASISNTLTITAKAK